jgi:hypothetical protein
MSGHAVRNVIIGSLVAVLGLATGLTGDTTAFAAPPGGNSVNAPAHHKQATSKKHHQAKAKKHSQKKHHKATKKSSKKHHKTAQAKKHHTAARHAA